MATFDISLSKPIEGIKTGLAAGIQGFARFFQFPHRGGVSEKAKLLWLIKLRWVAIALFAVLFVPALIFGNLTRETGPVYVGILGVLIAFNFISQHLSAESKRPIGAVVICFQLAFDLLVLTGLLAVSGGFANPFVALFFLNASLGGILIPGRLSWPFLVLIHTLLGALQFQTALFSHEGVNSAFVATSLVFQILVLSFWFVMRSLGAYLERQSEHESQSLVAREKRDRLRSIGALAAGFSHEFASPLNVARIRLERIKRQLGESEDAAEALNAILSCQHIIHQMNSAQLDSRDFHFKKVIVGDLLRDVIESWKEDKENVRLDLNIQRGVEALLPPINFSQVVMNLLDNAYEAHPSGTVGVHLRKEGKVISLSILDEGPGFPASILRQIGEPFVTTKKSGTGLGLYVSELFAQSLGGYLEVSNQSGRGAVITLSWPASGVNG